VEGEGDRSWERFAAELARMARAAEGEEVLRSRIRRAWLGRQAAEDLAWEELALGWVERGTEVGLVTTAGRRRGRLAGVGQDFVILVEAGPDKGRDELPSSHAVLIASAAICQMVPERGEVQPGPGHGVPGELMAMVDALDALAAARTRVRIVAPPSPPLEGDLRWVGRDLVCLLARPDRRAVYVPLAAIAELGIRSLP